MYAVIRAGGRQYKVVPGDRIAVDLLHKESGESVEYIPLLVVSDSGEVLTGGACEKWPVTAVVVSTIKDRKAHGFKYKPKVGYRRRWNYRQHHTLLEIKSVGDVVHAPEGRGKEEISTETDSEAEEGADG